MKTHTGIVTSQQVSKALHECVTHVFDTKTPTENDIQRFVQGNLSPKQRYRFAKLRGQPFVFQTPEDFLAVIENRPPFKTLLPREQTLFQELLHDTRKEPKKNTRRFDDLFAMLFKKTFKTLEISGTIEEIEDALPKPDPSKKGAFSKEHLKNHPDISDSSYAYTSKVWSHYAVLLLYEILFVKELWHYTCKVLPKWDTSNILSPENCQDDIKIRLQNQEDFTQDAAQSRFLKNKCEYYKCLSDAISEALDDKTQYNNILENNAAFLQQKQTAQAQHDAPLASYVQTVKDYLDGNRSEFPTYSRCI